MCVISLLVNCPPDAVNSRKELLVATRHILATDFRKGFFKKIDFMLDESVLIGPPRVHENPRFSSCRPLAYSTLADLVHHVRADLSVYPSSFRILSFVALIMMVNDE
jgi:transformation/transcription domain-associated protein